MKFRATSIGDLLRSGNVDATVGAFTADAELTATFGDGPDGDGSVDSGEATLKGTIKGFKGDAVNTVWELTLEETELPDAGGVTAGSAKVGATSIVNTWSAQLYGDASKRPAGVVGDFDGRF